MLTDALTGPIRYALNGVGLDILAYAPKAIALVVFVYAMALEPQPVLVWSVLMLLFAATVVGIFKDVPLLCPAFAVFQLAPLLLAIVAPIPDDERLRRRILYGIAIIWVITSLGIIGDALFDYPWKGLETEIGGQDIEASRQWGAYGIDRLAGFSRMSVAAALYEGVTGLMLFATFEKKLWKFIVVAITFTVVLLTTTKSAVAAVVAAAVLMPLLIKQRKLRYFIVGAIVIAAIALPVYSTLTPVTVDIHDDISLMLLASFDDRLTDTWPVFSDAVSYWIGEGLGGVGSAVTYFEPLSITNVADNYALYLIGVFGFAIGIAIYLAQFMPVCRYIGGTKWERAIGGAMLMLLLTSTTTDIIEAPPAALILGLALRVAYKNSRIVSIIAPIASRNTEVISTDANQLGGSHV